MGWLPLFSNQKLPENRFEEVMIAEKGSLKLLYKVSFKGLWI